MRKNFVKPPSNYLFNKYSSCNSFFIKPCKIKSDKFLENFDKKILTSAKILPTKHDITKGILRPKYQVSSTFDSNFSLGVAFTPPRPHRTNIHKKPIKYRVMYY